MKIEDLRPGTIVMGPKWPERVEVNKAEDLGGYVRIIGAQLPSAKHVDQILSVSELQELKLSDSATSFQAEAWKTFLALEAKRYRFASLYDPLLAMNVSKVEPLPHQIDAVYGHILKLPRIRFLIADDPGAGKTIMAGLIIKELELRNIAKRFLIVVPGHLKDQWIRELKDRFEDNFTYVSRGYMNASYGENVWEKENRIITSIDFAKRSEILPSLKAAHFDLIIVDEAHKMSAYRYGDKTNKTDRYLLGETLSEISEHLLFLTATPHQGDPENFRLFMDLLEPGFFADAKMLADSIAAKDNPMMIRRIKEELKDFDGKPLFLPRHATTVAFDLLDKEKLLYNGVSKYVYEEYNKALAKDKRRNVAFALIILQRRIASSTYALFKSLSRRKARLEALIQESDRRKVQTEMPAFFESDEVEEMTEEERWKEEALWETLSVAENREELRNEISIIEGLIKQSEEIISEEGEIKLRQLKETMSALQKKYANEKILIFTESKDTLDYLEKRIRSWGFSVNVIHGSMNLEDRVKAESVFKNETQVLIATEAAGEGINLQFCHLMINYDLPWNPNRLEQRMGRIHRYGQTKEVFIFNMVAANTREGRVMERILEKLEEIRKAMRSDKVYDVISEVFYGKDLSQLLLEAASSARDINDILKELDIRVDEEYVKKVKENLGESLATKYINFTHIKEMSEKAREQRLIPEYTQAFFLKAFTKAGGVVRQRGDGFLAIESVPYAIRSIAEEYTFRRQFGLLVRAYPKATFDKEIASKNNDAEFVSFGHPLFESTLEWVETSFEPELAKGAVFCDPSGVLNGYILFFEGEIADGNSNVAGRRLFAYFVGVDGSVKAVPPAIIWDLAEATSSDVASVINTDSMKERVFGDIIGQLESYKEEIGKERVRQAEIKRKYGLESLKKLIIKLDGDLIELEARKGRGDEVDIVIRNKQEQKRKYEDAERELKNQIAKETNLTMGTPRFLGIIRVSPSEQVEAAMQRDEEVEKAGMELAISFERKQGRVPEDVSAQNLGFDIRSRDASGRVVRYIEVKARASVGAVAPTPNEYFKAHRLGQDYYLYVVMNAMSSPQLYIIQDPAARLLLLEKVEVVRYIVSAEEILSKAEKVEHIGE
jgi:superfamily II DNA or RNA helicase